MRPHISISDCSSFANLQTVRKAGKYISFDGASPSTTSFPDFFDVDGLCAIGTAEPVSGCDKLIIKTAGVYRLDGYSSVQVDSGDCKKCLIGAQIALNGGFINGALAQTYVAKKPSGTYSMYVQTYKTLAVDDYIQLYVKMEGETDDGKAPKLVTCGSRLNAVFLGSHEDGS
jgi:hypothetical protein